VVTTAVPPPPEPVVHGPITRTDIVRYQGASGDLNPIHHDEAYTRGLGLPSPFSAGMFQAGLLASYATGWLGAQNVRRYAVRFAAQVWPGDVLTCAGTVARQYVEDGESRVDVDLTCTRQDGDVVVRGRATFVQTQVSR
jgi:acyl dehydratase